MIINMSKSNVVPLPTASTFNEDRTPVRPTDKSMYRYKGNDSLRAWRLELQKQIRDEITEMHKYKPGTRLRLVHLALIRRLAGQCSRITCILRDRWEE